MALTFPSSPTNGEKYPTSPTTGTQQYQWSSATSTWLLLGAASGVTVGTYGDSTNVGQFTVDTQGFITFAQNVPIASSSGGSVTSVATGTGLTGGPVTTTGTIALADTAVSAGSYTYAALTVDAQGRLTAASSGTTPVTTVTGTSPIVSSGGATPAISLANTTVTAGSYTYAALTVDAQGRLTAASSGGAPVCCSSYTAKGTILAASAASTPTALAVGTDGQALIADSTCTTGIKWGASGASAATPTVAGIVLGCTTATNSALGCSALAANTGTYNTANGSLALCSNTTGSYNTATGESALYSNTTGANNAANGVQALSSNTTGNYNTANGYQSLFSNTTGNCNTANGIQALYGNTTGNFNTANGIQALSSNTTGSNNVANGVSALYYNTTGSYNAATGVFSLFSNTTGTYNVANGTNALYSNTTGVANVANGASALYNNTTGCGNIGIGGINSAGVLAPAFNITTQNNRISMGSTSVTNADIQVAWTLVSDARDKIVAGPVPHGLDFVQQLQPKEFHFKETRDSETPHGPSRYGFLAQDILALEGDHPVIINDEDSNKLRYTSDHLLPVLVNAVKELSEIVSDLRQELNELKIQR